MGPADNNLLEYVVTWNNGLLAPRTRWHTFRGHVVSHAIPYSNVNATANQSGTGLAAVAMGIPLAC